MKMIGGVKSRLTETAQQRAMYQGWVTVHKVDGVWKRLTRPDGHLLLKWLMPRLQEQAPK